MALRAERLIQIPENILDILQANTAQAVSEMADEAGLTRFHTRICQETWQFARSLTQDQYPLEVLLLGKHGDVLGQYAKNS